MITTTTTTIIITKTIIQLATIWCDHISARLFCPPPTHYTVIVLVGLVLGLLYSTYTHYIPNPVLLQTIHGSCRTSHGSITVKCI